MKTTIVHLGKRHEIDSCFSLQALIDAWQQKKRNEKAGDEMERLGIKNFDFLPEDQEVLGKIRGLIQQVFPSALTLHHANDSHTSIHLPFQSLDGEQTENLPIDLDLITDSSEKKEIVNRLYEAYYLLAYQTIIEQLYGIAVHFSKAIIYKSIDPKTQLVCFKELVFDASFLSATCKKTLPAIDKHLRRKLLLNACIEDVAPSLPALEDFQFSGLLLASERDVTHREITKKCRSFMVRNEKFPDKSSLIALRQEMRYITGLEDIDLGLFLNADYAAIGNAGDEFLPSYIDPALNAILRHQESAAAISAFFSNRQDLFISSLSDISYKSSPLLALFYKSGIKSLLLYPLKINEKLVGIFGIGSPTEGSMKREHVNILEPLVSILTMAMERSVERLETKVDKIIKEQFTAVQSSVDWKFKEVALHHLRSGASARDQKIEKVVFENVHPLYGSIDVRNSSIERMNAIQQDLLKQLRMVISIVEKAAELSFLPLLGEMKFRLERFVESVSVMLFPGDEVTIQQYLQNDVSSVMKHLARQLPSISGEIEEFFNFMNSDNCRQATNCSQFEQSITSINRELTKFIDEEQEKIQAVYPHYFERFVTDGIDFNIYMGQSICPAIPFEQFHLQNLKLWQLSTLIAGARLTYRLSKELPVPLQTTQLILVHSKPINISFRSAERKFDVDGAYNIHYEIVKKRIDKVRIRSTNERLTQPGTIAIVYSHASEAKEYAGYLEYLEKAGLVFGEVEHHELEELRGVVGLKALRVRIVMETTNEMIAGALQGEAMTSRNNN